VSNSTNFFDSDDNFLDELLELNDKPQASAQASASGTTAEVGMAELNSLADLFENEETDWEKTWQEDSKPLQNNDDEDWLGLNDDEEATNLAALANRSQGNHPNAVIDDELNSLFGEEFATRNLQASDQNSKETETGDFLDLFDEPETVAPTANDHRVPLKPSSQRQQAILGDELDSLFAGVETQKADSKGNLADELESLFASKARSQTPETQGEKPKEKAHSLPDFIYYHHFSELEALLNEPATPSTANGADSFADLDTLLKQPPNVSQPTAEAPKTKQTTSSSAKPVEADVVDEDDEFSELEELLEQVDRNLSGASTAKAASAANRSTRARVPKARLFDQTMRVPVKQLDTLSNLVGELVVNRNSLEQDQERLRQFLDNLLHQVQGLSDVGARMQDLYERSLLESSLLASRQSNSGNGNGRSGFVSNLSGNQGNDTDYDPLEMDRFTNFHLLSQEMIELIVRVRESASDIEFLVDETDQVARNLRQVTTQLQEGLTKSRMIPFAQTADRLPRAIREISLKLNKQAELQVEGRDTLIDKMILEHLYDPMTHLINNAITHGIEIPEVRKQANKSPTGCITIRAFHQGNQTVISVSDDGAGINSERVKAKAIEKGLITPGEARALNDTEVYDFLFHPGFSTKDKADDFAGRGVGMDVVRTSLSDIRGTVGIDSTLGKGTTFTIRLPLTLSICKALCCSSANERIAFPMDGVEDMQDIHPQEMVENSDGVRCVQWRDILLPCHTLSELLSYNRRTGRSSIYGSRGEENLTSIVILRSVGNYLAVEVDAVLGEQEIVIKQLEGPVPKPAGIAGATVQGDGRIMAIADVLELIEIAQGRMRKDSGSGTLWQSMPLPTPTERPRITTEPLVLIVDDSITVRELLSITFNKAGYRVEQARDGQEAWDKIRAGLPCDLVFCDIEMPRMDGLELLSRLQGHETHKELPIALLTSRGATRHRQIAAEQGAKGYFTKPYLEEVLLDAAQRMLRGEDLLHPQHPSSQDHQLPNAKSKVLIIDDSVTVRELLSMTFNKAGYEVEQARDGQEAWDKIHDSRYDVVFCDIEMPRMDGLELLKRLQEEDGFTSPPIAMLTSRGAERHKQVAAERGASGYYTKPYLEEVLLDAAKRMAKGEVLLENSVRAVGV
jgi:chemotaxis protein histidine kinase CheA/DNA-binding response OmpR family regulator